jgi:hypothetical protein
MAIAGALIGKGIGAFGRKPNIPDLPNIDPSLVQGETVAGNQKALPGLQKLGADVNAFNTGQAQDMFRKSLDFLTPGGFGKLSGLLESGLRGELNSDVQQQILSSGAARALASGTAGSGFARNATLRDLGLTSFNVQQQALGTLTGLAQQTRGPQFDVTSMFFSPQQRLEFAFQDRSARFQRNLLAEQVAAAPDPATAALGREVDRFFNTVAGAGMMAAGGGMGGGGMGGGL